MDIEAILVKKLSFRLLAASFSLSSLVAQAGSFSYSTDFDGTGTGTGFTVNFPDRSSSGGPSYSSGGSTEDSEARYLRQQYDRQLEEAQKRYEEEILRQKLEKARKKRNVEEIQRLLEQLKKYEAEEPSLIERMKLTEQVLAQEKKFAEARQEYLRLLPSRRSRLAWSIDHIVVPPPPVPRHYNRILLEGMWCTPEEARKDLLEKQYEDPFNGLPYDDIFAFGTDGKKDVFRAGFDHLLGHFDRLTPETQSRLAELRGATVDELVCHSNGCRVAEVLIEQGLLKVNRLRILGGDNVMLDLHYLRDLQERKQLQELTIYVMKDDPVPVAGTLWTSITDGVRRLRRPLSSFDRKRDDLTYQALGLTHRPSFDPDARFQVHEVSYPSASRFNIVEQHKYENYARVINGWRRTQCLEQDGSLRQKCMLY